jgi:hypothetical protein
MLNPVIIHGDQEVRIKKPDNTHILSPLQSM